MRQIKRGDKCEQKGCSQDATSLVSEGDEVMKYCDWHAEDADYRSRSEYTTYCPNCGCQSPVN